MLKGMAVSVFLLCLVSSCGGSSSSAKTPPQKCDDLVNLLCQRAVQCANDGTTQAECVALVKGALPCASAVSVSASYDACVNELSSTPCTVLLANDTVNLPATCEGVILLSGA